MSMQSVEFNDYLNGILEMVYEKIDTKAGARQVVKANYYKIKSSFYEDVNPETVVDDILKPYKRYIKESVIINEVKGIDEPIRRVVRDITNIVKSKEYGEYYLPEDVKGSNVYEYDFDSDFKKFNTSRSYNIPPFSIELTYDANFNMDEPYMVNASLLDDNETIGMVVIINPEHFPQLMYDLIADVNDLVAHEIEHVFQEYGMRPEEEVHYKEEGEEEPEGVEYYTQKHEIPAELKGIIRVAKLRKQPIEQVIMDWFKRSKYAHQLNDEEINYMVNFLSNEYKQRYGTV
jgi:hypothetical protein